MAFDNSCIHVELNYLRKAIPLSPYLGPLGSKGAKNVVDYANFDVSHPRGCAECVVCYAEE